MKYCQYCQFCQFVNFVNNFVTFRRKLNCFDALSALSLLVFQVGMYGYIIWYCMTSGITHEFSMKEATLDVFFWRWNRVELIIIIIFTNPEYRKQFEIWIWYIDIHFDMLFNFDDILYWNFASFILIWFNLIWFHLTLFLFSLFVNIYAFDRCSIKQSKYLLTFINLGSNMPINGNLQCYYLIESNF